MLCPRDEGTAVGSRGRIGRRVRLWAGSTRQAFAVTASNPAIVRLQLAYLAVFAASSMLVVALSIVAFQAAGPSGVAILTLAQMVPTFFIVPVVSGLESRVPRHRLLTGSLIAGAIAATCAAAVLFLSGPVEALYLAAAVLAAATGVLWAVMTSLLPSLARTPEELVGGNVAVTAVEGLGGLAGPLAASVLLVVGGPALIAAAATLLFLVALAAATGHPCRPGAAHGHATRGQRPGPADSSRKPRTGLRTLLRLPGPRLVALAVVAQTFVRGALGVLIVVLAFDVLDTGDTGVAMLTAAIGLGGLLGSGLAAGIAVGRLGPLFAVALIAWGLPIALIAPMPTTLIAIAMLIVVGTSNAVVDVAGYGLLQGSIPDRHRTGALGALRALVSLGMAVGSVAASVLLSIADAQQVLVIIGLVLPVMVLALWPRWRRLDDRLLVSRELVDALRRCPIFVPLTLAQLEQLAGGTVRVRFEAGAVVIAEGQTGDAFYLITEGHIAVTSAGEPVNTMGPGESFGEIALVRGVPRTATVTATSAAGRLPHRRIDVRERHHRQSHQPRRRRGGRGADRAGAPWMTHGRGLRTSRGPARYLSGPRSRRRLAGRTPEHPARKLTEDGVADGACRSVGTGARRDRRRSACACHASDLLNREAHPGHPAWSPGRACRGWHAAAWLHARPGSGGCPHRHPPRARTGRARLPTGVRCGRRCPGRP